MRNTRTQMTYNLFGPGGMPSMTSTDDLSDVNHWSVVKQSIQKHLVDDENFQTRVDITYEFDDGWLDTFQAGARIYRQDRGDTSRYLNSRAFLNQPVADFGGVVPFPASDFLSGLGVLFQQGIPNPNFDALQETFITRPDDILNGRGFNTGTDKSLSGFTQQGQYNEDINHEDDGDAIYAMVTFSGEIGNIPYSGNLGVRYVDNSTGSIGEQAEPIDIDFSDPASPEVIVSVPEFIDISHSYSEVLPSLNLKFDLRDDLVGRVSAAKVMSRPRFLDLSPRQTVQARPRTMRGGNGELDPTTAFQVDLALEWYFADYSIASIGVFYKDIESFVQSEVVPTPFPSVTDPETGLPLVLTAFRPLNTGDSDLTGVELAYQTTFSNLPAPWDGLGVLANWTYIDSGSDFENEKTMASYGIPGMSENTINLTVFYEKGPWSARVSYNSRDEFLDDINGGFSGHPYFVEDYDQVDASIGYTLNDNISFKLDAINLTEEDVYYYSRLATAKSDYRVNAIHTGKRFQFGVHWKM
jgi:TonB-dependent receptor